MFKQESIAGLFDSGSEDEYSHCALTNDGGHELKLPEPYSDEEDNIRHHAEPDPAGYISSTRWERMEPMPYDGLKFPNNRQDYFTDPSGPREKALTAVKPGNVLSAFMLLFDDAMVDTIVRNTTMAANRTTRYEHWKFSKEQFYLYLAILLGKASCDARHLTISDMFSLKWGSPFYSKCLSKTTFDTINRFLRFDNKETREDKVNTDREAIISEVWNRFNANCLEAFQAGPNLTLDMQLAKCDAQNPFIQCAPDSEGMKQTGLVYSMVVDCEHGYVLNSRPYFYQENPQYFPGTLQLAQDLLAPFLHTRRTVTASSVFTSVDLASHLLSNNTFFVGTYRANHPNLPRHLQKPYLSRHSSEVYHLACTFTLTRYKHKWRQIASILSSQHASTVMVSNQGKRTPDTFAFYEKHCDGVLKIANTVKSCSTRLPVARWTLYAFFNLLDLVVINAQILYRMTTNSKLSRPNFLQQLAEELAKAYLPGTETQKDRCTLLDPVNKQNEGNLIGADGTQTECPLELEAVQDEPPLLSKAKRSRCKVRLVPECKQNKTANYCRFCKKPTCRTCMSVIMAICKGCWENRHIKTET